MPDMLVNLLTLPKLNATLGELEGYGIVIRRAQPFESTKVLDFVEQAFSISWADEISVGLANKPVSVFVAIINNDIVGFAAYECTRRSFFGPMGVVETLRGRGIGRALLFASLRGLAEIGYVYGIIGGAGPIEFYEKAVGATVIPGSDPGIYTNSLK